ncbi:transcription elongation factor GreA/GreB family protein [Dokdonia sp. MED134]|uniref:GreA/GreB family elongation factor n=1 Tax=Dokdonia sp. MED134 TaxID=313590 RepID=UPI000068A807|nr:GreA/GreB family elongation factor [Dokdonia sp. MED134]EAQ37662.1 transcription elongation factor GreA/GreB family protein [Dokdonia sp. MED134]
MSRGFVKEDDQEEIPIIPPRAALPDGVTNYVTSHGLTQLKEELSTLDNKISTLDETDERERRRALAVLNGKRNLLLERIQSARLLDHIKDEGEIRFGATVTYTIAGMPKPITIQIVGVDEASVKDKKIAFTAPIARALIGKKVDETTTFQLGNEEKKLTIKNIAYVD